MKIAITKSSDPTGKGDYTISLLNNDGTPSLSYDTATFSTRAEVDAWLAGLKVGHSIGWDGVSPMGITDPERNEATKT